MHSKLQRDPIGQLLSKCQKTGASKAVDRLGFSRIVGGNVKWCRDRGNQSGGSSGKSQVWFQLYDLVSPVQGVSSRRQGARTQTGVCTPASPRCSRFPKGGCSPESSDVWQISRGCDLSLRQSVAQSSEGKGSPTQAAARVRLRTRHREGADAEGWASHNPASVRKLTRQMWR